jgi:hypothetical protein
VGLSSARTASVGENVIRQVLLQPLVIAAGAPLARTLPFWNPFLLGRLVVTR